MAPPRPRAKPSPGRSYIPPPAPPPQKPRWSERRFSFSFGGRPIVFGWLEIAMIFFAVAMMVMAVRFRDHYQNQVEAVRAEIRQIIQERGYEPDDPVIRAGFGHMQELRWLSDVRALREEALLLRLRTTLKNTPRPNPEPVGYLEYVTKGGKEFNDAEAIKWLANSYRGDRPAVAVQATPAGAATPTGTAARRR